MPLRQKIDQSRISFRRLSSDCERGVFSCGYEVIDNFFKHKALKNHESLLCKVVTAHLDSGDLPVGFYAMSIESEPEWHFQKDLSILEKITGRIKNSNIITINLCWVAVQTNLHRQGVGTLLMGKALDDFREVVDRTGVAAMTLKPISTNAATFYKSLGFLPYTNEDPQRMFLSADTFEY